MQDKFYILKPAVDTGETGNVFPAVESYEDYDFNAPNSVHKLNHHEFPNFVPDIRFKLVKGAKFCDVMGQATISTYGLLISEKLKTELKHVNIPPHKYYSAVIEDNNDFRQYYWLQIVWKERAKIVDYSNSIFYKKRGRRDLGDLTINSEEDYLKTKEKLGSRFMISHKELILNTIPKYDLWTAPYKSDLIIPDTMKSFFEKFTGISITKDNTIKALGLLG